MGRTYKLLCLIFAVSSTLTIAGFVQGEIHRASSSHSSKSQAAKTATTNAWNGNVSKSLSSKQVWICSIVAALAVGLCGILPLMVFPFEACKNLQNEKSSNELKVLLSFAVGGLLGDVFFHLLPETWAHNGPSDSSSHLSNGLWVLFGIFSFSIFEKVFESSVVERECGCQQEDCAKCKAAEPHAEDVVVSRGVVPVSLVKENGTPMPYNLRNRNNNLSKVEPKSCQVEKSTSPHSQTRSLSRSEPHPVHHTTKVTGYLNLFANCVDNFTHGLAVSASFLVSFKVGVLTTLAILVHEVPHEVGDFAILIRSGFSRWDAAKAQLVTATGSLLGAVAALSADSAEGLGDMTAWILPFTSGGFINIALVTVLPELLLESSAKESTKQVLSVCAGVSVMYVVTFLF